MPQARFELATSRSEAELRACITGPRRTTQPGCTLYRTCTYTTVTRYIGNHARICCSLSRPNYKYMYVLTFSYSSLSQGCPQHSQLTFRVALERSLDLTVIDDFLYPVYRLYAYMCSVIANVFKSIILGAYIVNGIKIEPKYLK